MTALALIKTHAIPGAYALLPSKMRSTAATAMLLSIGTVESGFRHRRQLRNGPARGFFQFEKGGIYGVMTHHATRGPLIDAAEKLCYGRRLDADDMHAAVADNDFLAVVFARLLLWTLPKPLPWHTAPRDAYEQYLEAWRPGVEPPYEKWVTAFQEAWENV